MKKFLAILLCSIMALSFVTTAACSKKKKTLTSSETVSEEGVYLVLEANSVTMYEDETYALTVKKYDNNDKEMTIGNISYNSDSPLVASVNENGEITANKLGTTYIHVTADGLTVSCFVTVDGEKQVAEGLQICFTENQLYTGVPARASVCVFVNGVITQSLDNVEWSVEDESVISVENGVFIAKKVATGAVVKATGTYNGEPFAIEKAMDILAPTAISTSLSSLKIAGLTTPSGKANVKCTSLTFTVDEYNEVTGEKTPLNPDEYELSVENDEIVNLTKSADGLVTVTALSEGKTNIIVQSTETTKQIKLPTEVVTPVSEIADMDVLALASCNSAGLLSKSYMLVNDINYEGELIYPIACFPVASSYQLGYQWKYLLDCETVDGDRSYTFVERDKVGQNGYGLTDDEYRSFVKNYDINPKKTKFTGTFDGNGYSIKNAKLMFDVHARYGYTNGFTAGIFIGVNSATIKNIGFENISAQTPSDCTTATTGYVVDKIYNPTTKALETTTFEPKINKAGVVVHGAHGTYENIFVSFDYGKAGTSLRDGAVCVYTTGASRFTNCVIDVSNRSTAQNVYAFAGEDGGTTIASNNLAIGVKALAFLIPDSFCGNNGNWWTTATDWSKLYDATAGANATALQTLAQSIATFDTNVWDMSELIAKTGAPKLKKGCIA